MQNSPVVLLGIVKSGLASKFSEEARKAGSTGATIVRAEGTISNKWLNMLGLHDDERELIISVVKPEIAKDIVTHLNKALRLDKQGNGVIFAMNTSSCHGNINIEHTFEGEIEKMPGHQMIVTIVERGLGDNVVETAREAGAVGATISHGRGVGTHEKAKLFNIQIEPEKEIVFMVVENEKVESINKAISDKLQITEPGHGLLFTLNVNQATGLFEDN